MSPSPIRTAVVLLLLAGFAPGAAAAPTLTPFRSEAQLVRSLDSWHAREQKRAARQRRMEKSVAGAEMPPMPAPMAAAPAMDVVSTQSASAPVEAKEAGSITNNQVQGVDEGDIVKRQGDYLIVLRRGRLFTVRVGGDRLDAVAAVDAFGPGIDPGGTWYDEMLVSDGTVAVIGYSYSRGGTEVGVFDLDAHGGLRHRATYQLRSNDYYSSRNYASRLIGHTLVFYSPMRLTPWGDWRDAMPAYRRWSGDAASSSFHRMLPATRIYRGIDDLAGEATLHTVSICHLDHPSMDCESTAVLGNEGRVFHVAEDAVYVWTAGVSNGRGTMTSTVFRLPLDGGAPSSLRTWGIPVDQMAFLQKDGWLNVLVSREGDGEGMWASRAASGDLALLRVPVTAFGDAVARADRSRYRVLPGTSGWNLHQRFIGDWLVYGDGSGERPQVQALRFASSQPVQAFSLPHSLERIDALGSDAVLVGSEADSLVFTGLRLGTSHAALAGAYRRPDAQQGDARTHGFFYRPHDAESGVLGLPILRGGEHPGASVLYLRNRSLALSPLGTLDSRQSSSLDDRCRASCVDWYGNARPIFIGERVFALMGYELVEGRIDAACIGERRRVDFGPRAQVSD
ncbi:beta-propeller domain-containing protein [Cognatilysobacter lacus]|uniref:Beta propeller domain-containing protein n=1 Tax=Cognatilysobacter lacus TaxID=1643323 RepID=A0A5D8Z3F1_9GAMM|nr:beta-propeller domain-containing protein [Lysobacter lacus]TZF89518.1 hypothetical protein FW784_08685 [Lysobacter lacus]